MVFTGRHGVRRPEREVPARFQVDVELTADLRAPARTDELGDTVDYTRAYALVREVVEGDSCRLLETVAERIAERLLALDRVEAAVVRVAKRPHEQGEFRAFAVEIRRP